MESKRLVPFIKFPMGYLKKINLAFHLYILQLLCVHSTYMLMEFWVYFGITFWYN